MMPPKAKKTIPMPQPEPKQERQPQLVVVDIEKLQAAINIAHEVLVNGVKASVIGPFSSAAQDEGQ